MLSVKSIESNIFYFNYYECNTLHMGEFKDDEL